MKKTFMTFVMSALLAMSMFCIPATTASAAQATQPSTEIIVNELSKFETPYIGIEAKDFDFTNDNQIDVFDLVCLKQKLVNCEPGITIASAVKLEAWLLGKPNSSLAIEPHKYAWPHKPSEKVNQLFQNWMSNDFRFVRIEESNIHFANGDSSPAVILYFLGCDEYTLESVSLYNFCYAENELDEVLAENDGFAIGLKDNLYTLAPINEISEATAPETETENPEETITVEEPEEREMSSAYVKYDLRATSDTWTTEKVRNTIRELSTLLKSESYTFTAKPYTSEWSPSNVTSIQLFGETGLATVEIIVEEREPAMDTPIFDEEFYLYYSNKEGFGICFSNNK